MEELANKIVEDVLAVLGFGEDHPDYQLCVDKAYKALEAAQLRMKADGASGEQVEEVPAGGYYWL